MDLQAYGQNCIVDPIEQNEETWMGKVVMCGTNRLAPGTVVFYGENAINHFNLKNGKIYHVLWEQRIYAVAVNKNKTEKITGEFQEFVKK